MILCPPPARAGRTRQSSTSTPCPRNAPALHYWLPSRCISRTHVAPRTHSKRRRLHAAEQRVLEHRAATNQHLTASRPPRHSLTVFLMSLMARAGELCCAHRSTRSRARCRRCWTRATRPADRRRSQGRPLPPQVHVRREAAPVALTALRLKARRCSKCATLHRCNHLQQGHQGTNSLTCAGCMLQSTHFAHVLKHALMRISACCKTCAKCMFCNMHPAHVSDQCMVQNMCIPEPAEGSARPESWRTSSCAGDDTTELMLMSLMMYSGRNHQPAPPCAR